MRVVLASSSRYRSQLLDRLRIEYAIDSPGIDESPHLDESPSALVGRLAQAKARAVADRHPDALVIGCDQVAHCDGRVFGKPGDAASARAQLSALSGRSVEFLTGLCLLNVSADKAQIAIEPFVVSFRLLRPDEIDRYVELDRPFDCAGAFRSEGLGIALLESMRGDDPTALIGLPLIRLVAFLGNEGVRVIDSGRRTN